MTVLKMTDLDLKGKRVLIREDLNVPVKDGQVQSDARIKAALPTLKLALEKGAAVMVCSHLGRPTEGEFSAENSLKPVAEYLSKALGREVPLLADYLDGVEVKAGDLVLFENVRFNKGEKKNADELAQQYAALCDVFVMDAFGTAHRAEGTTYGIAQFAKIEPDPVARAQLVNDFMRANGIDPNATFNNGYLPSQVVLERRQEASASWLGNRDTVILNIYQTQSESLQPGILNPDDPLAGGNVLRWRGVRASWSHRLTPLSTLSVNASGQRTSESFGGQETTVWTGLAMWSYQLAQRSRLSLSARYTTQSGTSSYNETALLALTGDHPENPTLSLPCREVFARGQRAVEVIGPVEAVVEEMVATHRGFWQSR